MSSKSVQALSIGDIAALLAEAKTGSQEAVDELLKRHRAYLWALATDELAGETQPTFSLSGLVKSVELEAMRDLATFAGSDTEFRSWLRHILQNNIIDLKSGNRRLLSDDVHPLNAKQSVGNDRSPSSQVAAGETGDEPHAAIGNVPNDNPGRANGSEGDTRTMSQGITATVGARPVTRHSFGKFELLERIGAGAAGIVFRARDLDLRRFVALKVARAESLFSEEARIRFVREAQVLAAMRHPNIISIYEFGEVDGLPYIVEELCDGPNLAIWLRERAADDEPIAFELATKWMKLLAEAVAHAHRIGVVHRDLKPSNVLLAGFNDATSSQQAGMSDAQRLTPRITDFGIAKLFDSEDAVTGSQAVLGTAAYMAPEQADGKTRDVGPPADVYSLGVILYELLAGRRPIEGRNNVDTLRRVLLDDPIPVSRVRHHVPRDLEAICHKCLAKNPDERYQSAAYLADDLGHLLNSEPVVARRQSTVTRLVRQLRRRQFSSEAMLVGALLAAFLLAAIGTTLWRTRQEQGAAMASLQRKQQEESSAFRAAYPEDIRRAGLLLHDTMTAGTDRQHVAQEARAILAKYVPKSGEADYRGFEWHYLGKLLHPRDFASHYPLLRTIPAHHRDAYSVAFSPDGQHVATASADNTARVWDVETGQLLLTLVGHTHDVNCVAFSGDGKSLATASEDGTIRLWNASTGTLQEILWKYPGELVEVAFHPTNGHIAAVSRDGMFKVWDLTSHRENTKEAAQSSAQIKTFAYSADGKYLAAASADHRLRLWEASGTHRSIAEFPLTNNSDVIGFSHDGQLIAVGQEYQILVYRPATGELVSRFRIPAKDVRCLRFTTDDSCLIATGDDSATNLVDLATGETWNPFDTAGLVWCAACSPDGSRTATVDSQGTLRIWDSSEQLALHRSVIDMHTCLGQHVATAPDGRHLAIGTTEKTVNTQNFGDIAIWDIGGSVPRRATTVELRDGKRIVYSLAYSPDGRTLAVGGCLPGDDACIQLFDTKTWREKRRLSRCGVAPQKLDFTSDGSVIIAQVGVGGGQDWGLQFWDCGTGQRMGRMAMYDGPRALAISPDGDILATAATNRDGRIDIIRVMDQKKIATWSNFTEQALSLAFMDHGKRLIAESFEGHLFVLDCVTGNVVRQFTVAGVDHISHLGMGLSPDERTIALASSRGVVLVQVESGKPLYTLEATALVSSCGNLSFTSGGKAIVGVIGAHTKSGIYLWRTDLDRKQ